MRQSLKPIKGILIYTAVMVTASLAYFLYAYSVYPAIEEKETFLSEIGEGFGNIGLAALAFIYFRPFLKLVLGKGKLVQRLLPDYTLPLDSPLLNQLLGFLNCTHVYVGIVLLN